MQNNQQGLKLGYWGSRGKAQVSRLLLAYTGSNWQQTIYSDPSAWFNKDKLNLDLQFPNLPYLIDDDFKLTQSSAIQKYIIQRSGKIQLLGKDIHDITVVNQMLGVLYDVRDNYAILLTDKNFQHKLEEAKNKVVPKLEYFQKFVGDKETAIGYLTIVDFYLAEFSYYIATIFPQEYKQFIFLKRIRKHLNNLVQIKSYYDSQKSFKIPFVSKSVAAFQIKLIQDQ